MRWTGDPRRPHLALTRRHPDERLYVGKAVRDRAGDRQFLAFRNSDEHGVFVGGVIDPVPLGWRADARGLERLDDEQRPVP